MSLLFGGASATKMGEFSERIFGYAVGLALWICTGGLMFAHIVFSIWDDAIILGILGVFVPPIGLLNALSWIFSNSPITGWF